MPAVGRASKRLAAARAVDSSAEALLVARSSRGAMARGAAGAVVVAAGAAAAGAAAAGAAAAATRTGTTTGPAALTRSCRRAPRRHANDAVTSERRTRYDVRCERARAVREDEQSWPPARRRRVRRGALPRSTAVPQRRCPQRAPLVRARPTRRPASPAVLLRGCPATAKPAAPPRCPRS